MDSDEQTRPGAGRGASKSAGGRSAADQKKRVRADQYACFAVRKNAEFAPSRERSAEEVASCRGMRKPVSKRCRR
jgi:hypothetical protein